MDPAVNRPVSPFVPHPTPGRHLALTAPPSPRLIHALHYDRHNSVLSIAANDDQIFSGSQCEDILVWDKKSFTLNHTLRGHTGSVLALENAVEKHWLFSASGDSTVRIWSTCTLTPLYVLHPYLETAAGDIFSLAWNSSLQTLYIGCQNTSLQWFDLNKPSAISDSHPGISTSGELGKRPHKFFDSYPRHERRPADVRARNDQITTPNQKDEYNGRPLPIPIPEATPEIHATGVIDSAHYGYVYCLALLPSIRDGSDNQPPQLNRNMQLVTGSGDETAKLWECTPNGPNLLHTFECKQGAVLSIVVRRETIFAGCQDGYVKVWDLETKTLVRTIIVQESVDILSLSMVNSDLFTCSANGRVQRWSASFDCTASWSAHNDGIVLSSLITVLGPNDFRLITAGNDNFIKVWDVSPPNKGNSDLRFDVIDVNESDQAKRTTDTMEYALSKFISIPSVSSSPSNRENCRQAAIWLKKCLSQLGAQSTLLPTNEGKNPLVLATFYGAQGKHPKPRILFYGHYDVISAPSESWASDPFTLSGRNGYLYGRGATDNKGPIMAVAFAAAELLGRRALGLDLVFLIEGEEEVDSAGFGDAVRRHKDLIGSIDAILVSNSTWIAEDSPCITYGLRGVVHCAVEIASSGPDLHSGVEGGGVKEPMLDMIRLLSRLTDEQCEVQIPGFYDLVRTLTDDEKQLYQRLSAVTHRPASSLSSRWREPSLTVHNIEISGPQNATVIPATVKAQVSVRIVPDQDLGTIANSLCDYLKSSFATFNSPNKLQVNIRQTADWWLGNLHDYWFKALESAVRDEWGVEPLWIREGGSIPSVPYLEKEFRCHALHLPMGQSSDQAHLPNERISLSNLRRGKSVVERFFFNITEKGYCH